jgi:chitinase
VKEYDLDGVDVDYEDFTAFNGGTAEAWLITFQTELRSLLPSPYLISHAPLAPWFVASDYTNGGGGYAHVNQEVGSGIDFYNVQFYSQGASEYTDCTTLLTAAASPWQGSSLFEIANNQGVELNKLVIGKPVDSSAASNGYMDAGTLAGCVTQAKGQGWNAGLMVWEYRPSDATEAQTFMSTARGSS